MDTRRFSIKETCRANPIHVVKPADFVTEPADEIEPESLVNDPRFTLYCFDPENQAALFVESNDPAAVDKAAFYYQGQVDHAVGLVSMPLEAFHRVALEIPKPPKGVIFIHSVGRCGSTLVSKVLEAVPAVHSLSEPDDLTQLVNLSNTGGFTNEWVRECLASSLRWRGKPRFGPSADFLAIKSRSEVMVLADSLGDLFPEAKHFFLYRNALSWMGTLFRGFPADRDVYDEELNRKVEDGWAKTIPLVTELRRPDKPMNPVQVRVLAWITCMEGYLKLRQMDIPTCAARFEDITADPKAVLEPFFQFCGIDDVDWSAMEEVLSRDSQAGTIYDRDLRRQYTRELTEDLRQDIRSLIASRPGLQVPDVVLPGTIGI